jgi:hypothetical protein
MSLTQFIEKMGKGKLFGSGTGDAAPAVLKDGIRFPYGPFKFSVSLETDVPFTVLASTDLKTWRSITSGVAQNAVFEYIDSEASNFGHRFYRVQAGEIMSANTLGFASITLPPGFSLIANPFDSNDNGLATLFKGWPDGTTLNKFDARMFRLVENEVVHGKWNRPAERLDPGDGAIFYNPTSDYKTHNFVGDVLNSRSARPIPTGFSLRSSQAPVPGLLDEDLGFPIAEGDVIHLFDKDRQQYVLHPYEGSKWTKGQPAISVGEAFWVAKNEAGNWITTRGAGMPD